MAEAHAIRTMKAKLAELRGEVAQLEVLRRAHLRRIRDLDAALRVMTEGDTARLPYGRKRRWLFRRGELQRMVCGVIRDTGGKATGAEIARAIIAQMDWDTEDRELLALVRDKVHQVRKRLRASRWPEYSLASK